MKAALPELAAHRSAPPPVLSLEPTELATHCFFVAHGQKASVLWARDDYRGLCHRMLNGNSEHDFLMCYRDKQGTAKFSKAREAKARKRIDWAFDSICGTDSGSKTGIGFYPTNPDDESCWAALDFDAHSNGERERARALAGKAFMLLSANPRLWLILGTSGASGGWHLFIFTEHFYSTDDWSRLLREVADKLGVPIQKGLLEIFPDGRARGLGYGIRAPGSLNPKDNSFGLISFDGVIPKLRALPLGKEKNTSLSASLSTRRETQTLTSSEIFRGEHGEWGTAFAITQLSTRHDKLTKLVGTIYFQAAKGVARENARLQYEEGNPAPASSLDQHLADLEELWAGMERDWLAKLPTREKEKFDLLATNNERESFRIVRNWSRNQMDSPDFKIVCESLAKRLGVSTPTASNIRHHFCSLGILRKTAEYIPHKLACRYEWTANKHEQRSVRRAKTLVRQKGGGR